MNDVVSSARVSDQVASNIPWCVDCLDICINPVVDLICLYVPPFYFILLFPSSPLFSSHFPSFPPFFLSCPPPPPLVAPPPPPSSPTQCAQCTTSICRCKHYSRCWQRLLSPGSPKWPSLCCLQQHWRVASVYRIRHLNWSVQRCRNTSADFKLPGENFGRGG